VILSGKKFVVFDLGALKRACTGIAARQTPNKH